MGSYYSYFNNYFGGAVWLLLSTLVMTGFLVAKMGADYTVGNWAL